MEDIKILLILDNMKKIMFNDKYGLTAAVLIDKISGKGTWERNPYVLAYDFELVTNCNRLI